MSLTSASTARLLQYKTHIGAYMKKVSLPLITLILVCSVSFLRAITRRFRLGDDQIYGHRGMGTHSGFSEVGTRGLRQRR